MMTRPLPRLVLTGVAVLLLAPSLALGAGVQAVFDVSSPAVGPFPSDRFTVPDGSHNTGRRVALPKPDCVARPSDCADIDVINTLDGFNMQPRVTVSFTGGIDLATVSSSSIFLVNLGNALGGGGGSVVGINQVVWEPTTNTLYAESDGLLEQHTRYALVVTKAVRDIAGDPVEAGAFATFRHDLNFGHTKDAVLEAYRKALLDALDDVGVPESSIATMSVFTTQSVTAVLEKIRNQIKATTPAPANFLLGNGGTVETSFPLSEITSIQWTRQQSTVALGPTTPLPVAALVALGGVGTLKFGAVSSPDYETSAKFIPPIGTRTGVPVVQSTSTVYFNLFVPAGPAPVTGWPVAIFGHGFGDSKNNSPFVVASTMAAHGIATIAINVVGHGFGAAGFLTVNRPAPAVAVTLPAGGRGIDLNGNTVIDSTEGSSAAPPQGVIGSRDGLRQTVVDLMQLTRVIETGGIPGLDPSRIYYFGQSFGGIYGTKFLAVEPSVRLGVPNVPGGAIVEITRLSPVFRPLLGLALAGRVPSVYNVIPNPSFTNFVDNIPLRDQPPVTNTVPGTVAIQTVIDNTEWVQQAGNPVAYAPHIRKAPLAGVSPKFVILQFAKGDQTVPNPTTTAIVRAGDFPDMTTYYRNDLAFAVNGAIPKNPHTFLTGILSPVAGGIARAAQEQIATFFASETVPGMIPTVIDPDPVPIPLPAPSTTFTLVNVYEVPIVPPLPEGLNFIP